jgi:hemolysin activation/secretion protein
MAGIIVLKCIRGFAYDVLTLDRRSQNHAATIAIRQHVWAFVDGGRVARNDALAGEQKHDSISSFGVGARWNCGKSASLRLDLAHLLQTAPERDKGSIYEGVLLFVSA